MMTGRKGEMKMDEHLKAVAKRNADLYFKDKERFETRMFWCGWKPSEVQQMEAYINRIGKEETE